MTLEIKQVDSFEGAAAEGLAGEFPDMVNNLQEISDQISGVIAEIANQILKIDDYIEELQRQVDALYAELEAL